LHRWPPTGAFQPFNDTAADRYPRLFQFVQSELGAGNALDILSFGCSTGEEVFTLRRYFPRAAIRGIDINPRNIAICRRRLRAAADAKLSFAIANSTRAEPAAAYDAIFCMTVLCHGDLALPGIPRCDHLIRFAEFAGVVADFQRCLKPGGLLILAHSNFRLRDASAAAGFDTVLSIERPEAAKGRSIFGPDNRLIEEAAPKLDVVFRKKARP